MGTTPGPKETQLREMRSKPKRSLKAPPADKPATAIDDDKQPSPSEEAAPAADEQENTTTTEAGATESPVPEPNGNEENDMATSVKKKAAPKKAKAAKAKTAPKKAVKGKTAANKTAAKAAARTKVGSNGARVGSKTEAVVALLKRTSGCTTADILKATGWPTVSVPALCNNQGLKLQKTKKPGEPTRYHAT